MGHEMTEPGGKVRLEKPVEALVPDIEALLALAVEGLRRVDLDRSDVFATLSTFVLTHGLWEWARRSSTRLRGPCPYSKAIEEIATGTKHLQLRLKPDEPTELQAVEPRGGWGKIGWRDLGRKELQICLLAPRFQGDDPKWRTASAVLAEAIGWWRKQLGLHAS